MGSEGTLGIITELQLRLFGIPEQIAAGISQFDTLGAAVSAVIMVLQLGLPVARIELLDDVQMRASIAYSKLDELRATPTLFFELHGTPLSVEDQKSTITAILADFAGTAPRWVATQEDRTRLWTARHNAYWAARALMPGASAFATDACVPISALADVIAETKAEALASGFTCPIVGHVGDGNFHLLILYQMDQRDRADALATSIARRALAAGGTVTGEHGIGLHKMPLLVEEHGSAVAIMQSIKQALDPLGIMNPGKTIPDRGIDLEPVDDRH